MKEKYAVGLMSGTSLDGIDAALIKIIGSSNQSKVELLNFITIPFSEELRAKIEDVCNLARSNTAKICSLNFELGYEFAAAVKEVCQEINFDLERVDFIGSHGQTIWHYPSTKGEYCRSTLQVGEPAVIAYQTGINVVSNFRTMDIAAGGQGAPLVPYTEYLLFSSEEKGRIFQNIGGIGNLTLIPQSARIEDVIAFDTGPGNMIIDSLCQRLKGISYDTNGHWATVGKVQKDLLAELLAHPYIKAKPPKSTGREDFGEEFVNDLLKKYQAFKAEDLIATATMFTAKSIAFNYKEFILNNYQIDEVIIAGGGAYNQTLVQWITRELADQQVEVLTGEDFGISSEAKEAIAFALLANETLANQVGNAPGATGAREQVILGNITNIATSY